MELDIWMSEFYGMSWYKSNEPVNPSNLGNKYENENYMIECLINVDDHLKINMAQDLGYDLVETSIEFETLINNDNEYDNNNDIIIRKANNSDLNEILKITEECYFNHDKFYNRFKNKKYFNTNQSKEYFFNSVKNNYSDNNIIKVVCVDDKGICSYYIMKKLKGTPIKYKGVITGVSKRAHGRNLHRKMQNKISELIGKPYLVINRTQLNNYKLINNHIKEGKKVSKIEHYFYKKINK